MKHKLLITLLLISFNLFGQTERITNWFFGYEAGLDFSSGEPVANTSSNINISLPIELV